MVVLVHGAVESVSLTDLRNAIAAVAKRWENATESLELQPYYSPIEQSRNDRRLERIQGLLRMAARSGILMAVNKGTRRAGFAGRASNLAARAAIRFGLYEWRSVFLVGPQRPHFVSTEKWQSLALFFEDTMKRFRLWLERVVPGQAHSYGFKASRLIWIAIYLYGSNDCLQMPVCESIFAYALLYPLIDDYLDGYHELKEKKQFQEELRLQITTRAGREIFSSAHPAFQTINYCLKILFSVRFPHPDPNLFADILLELVDWEGDPPEQDLTLMTVSKGAYTIFALQMLVQGSLQREQSESLAQLGFHCQLLDDLQDALEDLADGRQTLVTTAKTSPALRRTVAKTLNMLRAYNEEDLVRQDHYDFSQSLEIALRETLAHATIEAAVMDTEMLLGELDRRILLKHSPLSFDFMQKHRTEDHLYRLSILLSNQRKPMTSY